MFGRRRAQVVVVPGADAATRGRWVREQLASRGYEGPADSVTAIKALRQAVPGLGLAAAVELAKEAAATGAEDASGAEAVVGRVMAAFERLDAEAAVACFAGDGVFHSMPREPVTGREAIRAHLTDFLGQFASMRFTVHHQAVTGGVVLNERTDTAALRSGRTLSVPVTGVFEVRDGRIAAWRDYFDPGAVRGAAPDGR